MRTALWITAGLLAAGAGMSVSAAASGGDGLSVQDGGPVWSRWQTRLAVGEAASAWGRAERGTQDGTGLKSRGISMMADYYFRPSLTARPSGFRATSGLLVGARASLSVVGSTGYGLQPRGTAQAQGAAAGLRTAGWPSVSPDPTGESTTVPYLGVGYTAASAKGGFSFSADLGLMAINSGTGVKLGRAQSAAQNLDDALRDMRLSPVLQLGVSYAF